MSYLKESFNPLPHAEGDRSVPYPYMAGSVSIHSLTQRETPLAVNPYRTQQFQSTPSRRGRQEQHFQSGRTTRVSIHSLTQRETYTLGIPLVYSEVSIHSLTQRETKPFVLHPLAKVFQSTPSRRGRPDCKVVRLLQWRFNPLPHAEGDMGDSLQTQYIYVSIHSLTQRETFRIRTHR